MVHVALRAATQLAAEGIEAEVIDPRSLRPIDLPLLLDSVTCTHRAIIVEEDCRFGGVGAEIAASLAESAFAELKAPVRRVAAIDVPTPYNTDLERVSIPQIVDVARVARDVVGGRASHP